MRASPSGVALCDDWTDGGTDDHSSISELTLDQFCSPQNKKPVVAGVRAGNGGNLSPPMELANSYDTASPQSWNDSRMVVDKRDDFYPKRQRQNLTYTVDGILTQRTNREINDITRCIDSDDFADTPIFDAGEGMTVTASGRFIVERAEDYNNVIGVSFDNEELTASSSSTESPRMVDRGIDLGTARMAHEDQEPLKDSYQ
eukprot:6544710-Ditylum_brightwellii.AAC.1